MSTYSEAVLAGLIALGTTAALTPPTAAFARLVGAVDRPSERGLGAGGIPRLGGLAMLAGVLVASLLALAPFSAEMSAVVQAAIVITCVGALDDRFDLVPGVKLLGQIAAAVIAVRGGIVVDNITIPLGIGAVNFGWGAAPLTVFGLVAVMNIVNFSDGIDGLAAGITAIAAIAFTVVAFDLGRVEGATLSAITAGAALGFLAFNFHPASVYMGDAGANLLGLLLGCAAVMGAVKTQAVFALGFPFLILAVPVLDTAFVVLKRLKYHQPVYSADREHFHHRLDRVGFSTRRAVLVLYAWTAVLAMLAVAARFLDVVDSEGKLLSPDAWILGILLALTLAASIAVIYVLEILKFERGGRFLRVRVGGPAPQPRGPDTPPRSTSAAEPPAPPADR